MKIKLGQLINSTEAINQLLQTEIKADKAFDIALFVEKMNGELTAYNKIREAKVKEFGEKTEDGNFKVKNENIAKFTEEINKMLEKDIEINSPELGKGDITGLIKPALLAQISYMIKK